MKVVWNDLGREPRAKSNPAYPTGIDLDLSDGAAMSCITTVPYPARRCGVYMIECDKCGQRVAVTTAGRPDDPRSVKLACYRPALALAEKGDDQ